MRAMEGYPVVSYLQERMRAMEGYPVVRYLLQQTLRRLCTDSDWVYTVFWRILPRNYPPPKWDSESNFLDRSKGNKRNWILVWEDGFCDFAACAEKAAVAMAATSSSSVLDDPASPAAHFMQPELFFKMSHEVYNFGEGLMGKVAADNSHKWVYKAEAMEAESPYPTAGAASWQGALDPYPRTWEAQFKSGIETIAIVAVKEGVLQLGSVTKTPEDLNLVLSLQRKFNYLQSIPGVYAVHPVLMQHATSSSKLSPDPSDVAESLPPDLIAHQHFPAASSDYWPPRQHLQVLSQPSNCHLNVSHVQATSAPIQLDASSLSAYINNVVAPHQLSAVVATGCASDHCLTPQLDVMQASLQALLSRLPAVTAPPPSTASSASTSPRGHPYNTMNMSPQQPPAFAHGPNNFLSQHFLYSPCPNIPLYNLSQPPPPEQDIDP